MAGTIYRSPFLFALIEIDITLSSSTSFYGRLAVRQLSSVLTGTHLTQLFRETGGLFGC